MLIRKDSRTRPWLLLSVAVLALALAALFMFLSAPGANAGKLTDTVAINSVAPHMGSLPGHKPAVPGPPGDAFLELVPGVDAFGNCPDSRCTGVCNSPAACNPISGDSVNTGDRFVLDLMVNTGDHQDASAMQAYVTYTWQLGTVGNVTQSPGITNTCILTSTINADLTTFDSNLQNEWCNGESGPCVFRGVVNEPGWGAYAAGALNNPNCQQGCGGDFRVAEIGWCMISAGNFTIHWQFTPPAPITRDTEIVDINSNLIHDPALFTDFHLTVSGPSLTPTNTPTITLTRTVTQTRTPSVTRTPTGGGVTNTPTNTVVNTNTSTATNTNTPTITQTRTNTSTNTPVPPTNTSTVTGTSTNTPVGPTSTPTNTSSVTQTRTNTSTNTPVPPTGTSTVTLTRTSTNTPVPPTNTSTITSTSTNTPVGPTSTPTNTSSVTQTRTSTNTNTPVPPSNTPTITNTRTNTPLGATNTATGTNTSTRTPVPPSNTPTNTPLGATNTATGTNTSTRTPAPPSNTPTITNTRTNTPVPPTATNTFTPGTPGTTPTQPAQGCNIAILSFHPCQNSAGCFDYSIPVRNNGDTGITTQGTVYLLGRGNIIIGTTPVPPTFIAANSTTFINGTICADTLSPGPYRVSVSLQFPGTSCGEKHKTQPVQHGTCPSAGISDVPSSQWYYGYVNYLLNQGIVSGYSDGTFRPNAYITRGQLAKLVTVAFNLGGSNQGTSHFSDVPSDSTYAAFIEAIYKHGIASGYASGTFRPGANVTRGQIAKIVVQAARLQMLNPKTATFRDVPQSNGNYRYVETAYANGILSGYTDGTFRPNALMTRAQVCGVLYQFVVDADQN